MTSVSAHAQYLGDEVHLCVGYPIFGVVLGGIFQQVAHNNYDRALFQLEDAQQDDFYREPSLINVERGAYARNN